MMIVRFSIMLFLSLFLTFIKAQNLIPNANFEKNVNGKVTDWLQPLDEYYHYETYSENLNGAVSFNSYNGLCLIAPEASEYLVIKLKSKLKKGVIYCANTDIFISSSDNYSVDLLKHIEWKFLDTEPFVLSRAKIYGIPDLMFEVDTIQMMNEFTSKQQTYTASGKEQYLVIGKFFDKAFDSIYFSAYSKRKTLNDLYRQTIFQIHDSFSVFYPPMPDYTKKSYKKKDTEAYDKSVIEIERQKNSLIEDIKRLFIDSLNMFPIPELAKAYNVRVYFDNLCLSEISKEGECNCKDSVPMQTLIAGNTYRLNNVNFETGSYELDELSKSELNNLALLLNQNPQIIIQLNGHTDNINSRTANLLLSDERAKACLDYLVSKGINTQRLKCKGFGPDKPITTNNTEEGRKINRRVEFIVL